MGAMVLRTQPPPALRPREAPRKDEIEVPGVQDRQSGPASDARTMHTREGAPPCEKMPSRGAQQRMISPRVDEKREADAPRVRCVGNVEEGDLGIVLRARHQDDIEALLDLDDKGNLRTPGTVRK